MKTLIFSAALLAAANVATAGTLEEPVMEEPVIIEEAEATSSSAGIWVPLVLLAIVAAAVAAD